METMHDLIARLEISADAACADANPNMADPDWPANHYVVTLTRGSDTLAVPFSQGLGITSEPDAATVLDCLASDAAGVENASTFEDWCAEYGYDTDSRSAERTYNACRQQTDALRAFLGNDFDALVWDTERL